MNRTRICIFLCFTLILAGCATTSTEPMTKTQKGGLYGAAGGAAAGAILGQVIGRDTKGTLIGTAIGAARSSEACLGNFARQCPQISSPGAASCPHDGHITRP